MNNIYKIVFIILLNLPISLFSQDGIPGGDYNDENPNAGAPGAELPIPGDCNGGAGWDDNGCDNETTGGPGNGNVPINDYIPLLALAAITIGGITFYRNQKQII